MASTEFTEEEQGRYDRQIRLWGLEAQQRMRSATILVVRLRGTATETIKNIVLAGIGKLIIVDDAVVADEDLGAGFFYRDEDVGKKRVEAAKARVESLNPLVTVETVSTLSALEDSEVATTLKDVDLVCVTDWDRETLIRLNHICRRLQKPFYAGGTFGLLGYIFCDLLKHEYINPDRSGGQKDVRTFAAYPPLDEALQFKWNALSRRQTKELNPTPTFAILAIWEYQSRHRGSLPDDASQANELQSITDNLLTSSEVNQQVLTSIPLDLIVSLSTTAAHEFPPVCAVVGGMLAQDILKTLAAREAPIANFFTFDGNLGAGTVCRMQMS